MKKYLLISIISIACFGSLIAQNAVFTIILNKGENTFGTNGEFNPVLLGGALSENDVLKVIDNGYIALVHDATGSSLELKKEGVYSVEEMEQMISEQSSTVLAKYGKFLMDKLNPDDTSNQNLNVTGAVERGEEGLIKIFWPSVMNVYGDRAVVTWQQVEGFKGYVVSIKNMFDELLEESSVHGTSITLELDKGKLREEKLMIINVRVKGNEGIYSRDYGIKRLSPNARILIENEFENLEMHTKEENVLNKLLLASFFEEHQLLVDAITFYNQALVISPDPEGIRRLYNDFLQRNGLN
jgi:hypothetical protein